MFARLNAAYDWFKRNRAKVGGALSTVLGAVATVDPQLVAAYPRVAAYLALVIGALTGAGAWKSDSHQKQKQEIEAVVERYGLDK
jgi:hypothetical protein